MKRLSILLTLCLLSFPIPAHASSAGEFFFPCPFSHRAMDDPIVVPGQPGGSHSHDFIGNNSTDAFSTADSLVAATTTCREPKDKTGYWFPTLIRSGSQITPVKAQVYYRSPGTSAIPQPFPFGLKIVQGDKSATGPQPNWTNTEFWSCGNAGTHYSSPPDCPSTTLMLQVRFPQCWDGAHLDSADHKSHMAYLVKGACPADHPILLPQVQLHIQYGIRDGASGAALSLASGSIYSIHADFFNAWDKARLASLITTCIVGRISCHF